MQKVNSSAKVFRIDLTKIKGLILLRVIPPPLELFHYNLSLKYYLIGDLELFRDEVSSEPINLIYQPILEPYVDSFVFKDDPVNFEVYFFSRPAPRVQVKISIYNFNDFNWILLPFKPKWIHVKFGKKASNLNI